MSRIASPLYPTDFEPAKVKSAEQELKERLLAFIATTGCTQQSFASSMGINHTQLNKFINTQWDKPEVERAYQGNIPRFMSLAEDVLRSAEERDQLTLRLRETDVSRLVNAAIEKLRKLEAVGLIHGPAGIGKSCAIQLYAKANPTAVILDCKVWAKSSKELERTLFNSIDARRYDWRLGRAKFLVERFKDSNRPLIIDNAQRLASIGLAWVFDFFDDTHIPIVFVGNPEVLDRIQRNDQFFSRILRTFDLQAELQTLKSSDPKDTVLTLIRDIAPDFESILPLALKVAQGHGRFRALRQQLRLARDMAGDPEFRARQSAKLASDPLALSIEEAAFRKAHTKLIRDYPL